MYPKNGEKIFLHESTNDAHQKIELSDLQLWKQFKGGDEGAFIRIYQSHINLLYHQGVQITRDRELVKDCLQDLFIEIRQHREKLSDTDNIKLYLLKCFRRRLISYLKKHSKYFFEDEHFNPNYYPIELAVDEKMINAQYRQEQLEQLNAALNSLPAKEREVLYYYFYQKLSYREIAQIYKFTHTSSARRLVYNSLKRLKSLFSFLLLVLVH